MSASASGKGADLWANLAERDASYDPEVRLLVRPMTKTYHTSFRQETQPYAHCLYSSAVYALELLDSGIPENQARAEDILGAILPMQDKNPDRPTCGIWPYFHEEPLERMREPDWNYADFIGKKLVLALKRHGDRLRSPALKREMAEAIELACHAIRKRDVGPAYTNIAVMGAFVTLVGGEVIGQMSYVEYGRNRLKRLYDYTLRLGTFVEFNSPTYTAIAIEELNHIHAETGDPESIRLSERLLYLAWKMAAERYHPRTKEWAGPHSRAYSVMLDRSGAENALRRWGEEEENDDPEPEAVRCPEELRSYFRTEEERCFRCPILDEEETGYQSYATTYMTEEYCLGSFSKDMMWHQRRNLIAYVDNGGKPAYVLLRFLKDGKDFSSAVFTGVQDKSDIVFGINMALDYGDWHPVLDPANGVFEADDIRIRLEIGGNVRGVDVRLGDEAGFDASAAIGDQTLRVKRLASCSDKGIPRMAVARSEKQGTIGIDYVIYSGPRERFDLRTWEQAAWAILFTLSPRAEELQAGSDFREGRLSARCEKDGRMMGIRIPAKPDRLERLYRYNEVSFMEEA